MIGCYQSCRAMALVLLGIILTGTSAIAQVSGIDALAKQFKPGQYQYSIESDMSGIPGMPKGMKLPAFTFAHCVTAKDVEEGRQFQQGKQQGDMRCQMSDVKVSGSSGSYTQTCVAPSMTMRADVVFKINGDTTVLQINNNMQSRDAGNMQTKSTMTMKYVGNCQ